MEIVGFVLTEAGLGVLAEVCLRVVMGEGDGFVLMGACVGVLLAEVSLTVVIGEGDRGGLTVVTGGLIGRLV